MGNNHMLGRLEKVDPREVWASEAEAIVKEVGV